MRVHEYTSLPVSLRILSNSLHKLIINVVGFENELNYTSNGNMIDHIG